MKKNNELNEKQLEQVAGGKVHVWKSVSECTDYDPIDENADKSCINCTHGSYCDPIIGEREVN